MRNLQFQGVYRELALIVGSAGSHGKGVVSRYTAVLALICHLAGAIEHAACAGSGLVSNQLDDISACQQGDLCCGQ